MPRTPQGSCCLQRRQRVASRTAGGRRWSSAQRRGRPGSCSRRRAGVLSSGASSPRAHLRRVCLWLEQQPRRARCGVRPWEGCLQARACWWLWRRLHQARWPLACSRKRGAACCLPHWRKAWVLACARPKGCVRPPHPGCTGAPHLTAGSRPHPRPLLLRQPSHLQPLAGGAQGCASPQGLGGRKRGGARAWTRTRTQRRRPVPRPAGG